MARPITVSVNAVGFSPWVRFDDYGDSEVSIQLNVTSGTVTLEQTLDDPNSPTNPVAVANVRWFAHPDPAFTGATGNVQGNFAYKPLYARLNMTAAGVASATFIQAGGGY